MKIVSWNCNGALRNKIKEIDKLNADILIIQECENPAKSVAKYQEWAGNYLWIGDNKNKGIGVFPKNNHSVKIKELFGKFKISGISSTSTSLSWDTKSLRLFLPFSIDTSIDVLGVWTKGSDSEAFGYMGQFWKFLQIHRKDLSKDEQLIIGDFNSNKQWDKKDRWWNHSDVIKELSDMGLGSLYHQYFTETQGDESIPTFYLHKNKMKSYHIDYAFISKKYHNSTIEIGQSDKWLELSDHMPLEIELRY